jgi:hypothetical protein
MSGELWLSVLALHALFLGRGIGLIFGWVVCYDADLVRRHRVVVFEMQNGVLAESSSPQAGCGSLTSE